MVTKVGNSYIVSGKDAKKIEKYVFKKTTKKDIQKEIKSWDKLRKK